MGRRFTGWLVSLVLIAGMFAQADTPPPPSAPGYVGVIVARDKSSGHIVVDDVMAGSPAALAGIKEHDWITVINGTPTQGMSDVDANASARGEVGTSVTWTVRGSDVAEHQVTLIRKSALETNLPAATAGDPVAEYILGHFYDRSPAPHRDLVQAVDWYRKAADQGYAPAQFSLGYLYVNGLVLPNGQGDASADQDQDAAHSADRRAHQDYAQALAWFRRAAAQDNPNAEYYLGLSYQHGHGVPQDYPTAFYWYQQAAGHNIAYAQWDLAYLYEKGLGVKKSNREALKWYTRAQAGLPQDTNLRAHIALLSLQAFVEDPDSAPLDLSLYMTAFRPELMPLMYALLALYLVGGALLFHFTLRKREDPPGLIIASGWLSFYMTGQAIALAAVYMVGALLTADNLFAATCLFSGVPVILSTLGPNRHWMWRPSLVSGKTYLLYAIGAFVALALVLGSYNQIYILVTHSALPAQPTAVLISSAHKGFALLAYACIAVILPMTEEILFRGYLFDALRKYCPDALTIILTAFAFALVHFQGLYFAPLFGFGLIQGWVKLRTGSLRLPVLLHIFNNALFLALGS